MEIPQTLYGVHNDVKARCAKHVKAIVKGAGFEELDFGELVDVIGGSTDELVAEVQRTKVVEGLVLLDRGAKGVRDPEQHFCLYPLADGLWTKWAEGQLREETIEQLFSWAGSGPAWRIGCVLGEPGSLLCHRFPRLRAGVLRSVLRNWPTLIEVGARYATGLFNGHLWSLATNITRGLGQLGATNEEVRACGEHMDVFLRQLLERTPSH